MKLSVIATTKETDFVLGKDNIDEFLNYILEMGGRYGATAYDQKEDKMYYEHTEKRVKRGKTLLKQNHRNVFEHVFINLYFEDITKFQAMVLNNQGMYVTTEKSLRYTVPDEMDITDKERELYNKWYDFFMRKGESVGVAKENARYMLDIFSKTTTMVHTISMTQLNMLYLMLVEYIEIDSNTLPQTEFYLKALEDIEKLKELLEPYYIGLEKYQWHNLRLFKKLPAEPMLYISKDTEFYTYNVPVSFAALAQIQRHRKFKIQLVLQGITAEDKRFYIPEVVSKHGEEIVKKWIKDLNSIDGYPQATKVSICESGDLYSMLERYEIRNDKRKVFPEVYDYINDLRKNYLFTLSGKSYIKNKKIYDQIVTNNRLADEE